MQTITRRLAELAARHKGLVTRIAALAAGISEAAIDHYVRAGILVPLYEGVYRHAAAPFTQDMRWLAAVLACGADAVLSRRAAATLLEWPGIRRARPEVTSPHTDLPRIDGVDLHRALRLRPFEVTSKRGIPVTAPGKTALDLCACTSFERAQEVISSAIIVKRLRPEQVLATLERSAGRGVPGTTRLRAVSLTLDEIKELESVLELHGDRELALANVPPWVRQYDFVCDDGRRVRFDVAWPDLRLGLDWDGKRWHATPARKRRTRERHESIVASSWGHLTYGWADIHLTPRDLRSEVESEVWSRLRRAA